MNDPVSFDIRGPEGEWTPFSGVPVARGGSLR